MTRKCIQCGKSFSISESEEHFFKSKNLSLPKRCKQCRTENKSAKSSKPDSNRSGYNSYYISKPIAPKNKCLVFVALSLGVFAFINNLQNGVNFAYFIPFVILLLINFIWHISNKFHIQEFDTSIYKYTFYDTNSMIKHYVKHCSETNADNMENYLYKANIVIIDKKNISKRSKDDDRIYFNKSTNEFVVVAKAGYIRTYFTASEKYYNKQ